MPIGVAHATIVAFLGVAYLMIWIAFQLTEKHDILKGLLISLGLLMLLLTVSTTQHFIEAEGALEGYNATAPGAYGALIRHSGTAFTLMTYMLYVIMAYVVIYYVFVVLVPKIMDQAMKIGIVKKSRKKRIDETHKENE